MSVPTLRAKVQVDDEASAKLANIGRVAKQSSVDLKSIGLAMSGVATGAINLYNSYDRVNNAQLSVEKSQLAVKRATESLSDSQRKHADLLEKDKRLTDDVADAQKELERVQSSGSSTADDVTKAQDKLNKALEKLASNKSATTGAVKDIEIAQDNLKIKTEQAEQAQDNLRNSIITGLAQAAPSIITIAEKIGSITNAWKAAKVAADAAAVAQGAASASGAASGAAAIGGGAALAGAGMIAAPAAVAVGGALIAGYGYGMKEQQKKDAAAEYGAIASGKMPAPNITHPNGLNQQEIDAYKQMVLAGQQKAAPKQIFRPGFGWVTVPGAAEGAVVGPNSPQLAMVGEGGEREFVSPESMLRRTVADALRQNRGSISVHIDSRVMNNTIASDVDFEEKLQRNNEKIIDELRRALP